MNLGYSNALWTVFWDRLFFAARLARVWTEMRDRARDRRTQVFDYDPNGNTNTAVLTGVRYRTNTAENGKIYVRITGTGPFTVSLYTAVGASGKVAEGSGAAGATITLAEQNSSGLSGTINLEAGVAAETSDAHYLRPYLDWRADADATFDRTDAQGEDLKSLESINAAMNDLQNLAQQAIERVVALFFELLVGDPTNLNDRAYGSKFMKEAFTALLTEQTLTDTSGEVSRLRAGALEALRLAMVDEATGSTQSVIRRLTAGAAAVAATGNDGTASIASHTPEAHCPTGTYTLTCVRGLGNGGGGQEQFQVSFASDEDDRTKVHSGLLTVGQAYKGDDGFGGADGITMVRTLSKTGDNSHLHLATVASGWTVSGERESNTNAGVLYWKIVAAGGSTYYVEFYKAASMQTGDLVARSTAAVAASTAFTATQRRGSGLQITGTTGSAPVDATTGTIDLNFHTTQNSTGRPDGYSIAVTLTSSGLLSKILAGLPILNGNGYRLNGVASGAELIGDGRAYANTWEDFSVEDN